MLSDDITFEFLEKYEHHPSKAIQEFLAWLSDHQTENMREILTAWDRFSGKEEKRLRTEVFDFLEKYKFVVLSNDIMKKFGEELRSGEVLLRLIVDVQEGRVYSVPPDIEHIDFAAKILRSSKEGLYQHPERVAHLVGAYIILRDGKVYSIEIGATTGLTLGLKVVYRAEDIDKAYTIVSDFVFKGKIPYEKVKVRKVMPKGR